MSGIKKLLAVACVSVGLVGLAGAPAMAATGSGSSTVTGVNGTSTITPTLVTGASGETYVITGSETQGANRVQRNFDMFMNFPSGLSCADVTLSPSGGTCVQLSPTQVEADWPLYPAAPPAGTTHSMSVVVTIPSSAGTSQVGFIPATNFMPPGTGSIRADVVSTGPAQNTPVANPWMAGGLLVGAGAVVLVSRRRRASLLAASGAC